MGVLASCTISIHAPREGGDGFAAAVAVDNDDFNPRPPRGGRLKPLIEGIVFVLISIHAPREGGDEVVQHGVVLLRISIHAPREGGD